MKIVKKKEILDILEGHGFSPIQSFTVPHPKEEYNYYFLEFLGRFNDLDFISAKADLKKDLSIELKLIGSYDVNINEIVQGM